jgi:hypothetical protein
MKKPKSELPWRFKNLDFEKYHGDRSYEVCQQNGTTIMHDDTYYNYSPGKETAEYIVQACNNFPKAIELLKESKSFKRIVDYERWIKIVEEFLKNIEDEK